MNLNIIKLINCLSQENELPPVKTFISFIKIVFSCRKKDTAMLFIENIEEDFIGSELFEVCIAYDEDISLLLIYLGK